MEVRLDRIEMFPFKALKAFSHVFNRLLKQKQKDIGMIARMLQTIAMFLFNNQVLCVSFSILFTVV